MTPLPTSGRGRALYHAAAVLAAGAQVALFAEAVRTFRKATGAKEPEARAALLPLALSALEKLRRESPAEAITGPAARGDLDTIAAHRRVLPRDLLALYDQLTRVSLALRRLRAEALPESAPAVSASATSLRVLRRRPPPPEPAPVLPPCCSATRPAAA